MTMRELISFTLLLLLRNMPMVNCSPVPTTALEDCLLQTSSSLDGIDPVGTVQSWPKNLVPFDVSNRLIGKQRELLFRALDFWEARTCVSFFPHSEQSEFVKFEAGERSCSFLGKIGGIQTVYISGNDTEVFTAVGRLIGRIDAPPTDQPVICPDSCGGNFNIIRSSHVGYLHSPNYPESYPSNTECIWKLTAQDFHVVSIDFQRFNIEDEEDCLYDFLELFFLDSQRNIIRKVKWCGEEVPDADLESGGTHVILRFHSDDSNNRIGFNLSYYEVEQPLQERQQNCDINNGGCDHWCIPHVHVTKSVLCACREGFNLAADGHTCQDIDECALKVDVCQQRCRNTNGSYQCFCRTGYSLDADQKTCNECGGRLTASATTRSIYSPGFPGPYPYHQNCKWLIEVEENHYLNITVVYMDIAVTSPGKRCQKDFLKLEHVKRKLCGYYTQLNYVVEGQRSTYVRFRTEDISTNNSGFEITYTQARTSDEEPGR